MNFLATFFLSSWAQRKVYGLGMTEKDRQNEEEDEEDKVSDCEISVCFLWHVEVKLDSLSSSKEMAVAMSDCKTWSRLPFQFEFFTRNCL